MRTRKQEHLPFRRRASFREASSSSRRSMRKTSSFFPYFSIICTSNRCSLQWQHFFSVIFHTVKDMAVTCHLRNPKTFAEQKAGLGSEERSRGRQPIKRAIRYNQEINLLYPCASEIIHHRHYIPK